MRKQYATEYALLSAQIDELEAKRKALKIKILEQMNEEGEKTEETEVGKFTRSVRAYWTYSDKIKDQEEKLKVARIKEQHNGTAKKTETAVLVFTAKK